MLALKWAVTEKFKDYLWGAQFTVFTDNNPLVHLDTAKLGAHMQRWVAQFANYTYNLKYRPGAVNQKADLLSRLPEGVRVEVLSVEQGPLEAVGRRPAAELPEGQEWTIWRECQRGDPELCQVLQWLEEGTPPAGKDQHQLSPVLPRLLAEWERLGVWDGLLVREVTEPDTNVRAKLLVVPAKNAKAIWQDYH